MSKHRKHAKLKLRENDNFAPNEIAIVGTKCGVISDLVFKISKNLGSYKIAYLDASHTEEIGKNDLDTFTYHTAGTSQISKTTEINKFNQRIEMAAYDFLFINGNHYQGAKQLLILDNEKEASVLKRLPQLNNIAFIIKLTKDAKYFDFLATQNPQIKNLHCYQINEIEKISLHIKKLIKEKIVPIQGLVLIGGKSTRMGTDKSSLKYYGKAQREITLKLLKDQYIKTFLSVNEDQHDNQENCIRDKFLGLGPFGGICSAFQQNPDVAWLVIATDLPFVDATIIEKLLKNRNPSKIATTLKGKGKQFPEPLITIWEPKSYPVLLNYLAQGYSCPRKVLINSDVEIIEVEDHFIRNINTPEDYKNAHKEINE